MTRNDAPPASTRPSRHGLVLGAGGVLGAAWMVGALYALHQTDGYDPRTAEVIVGTSAGAALATLLAAGASPAELHEHALGHPVATGPLAGCAFDYATDLGGAPPGLPHLSLGSPRLLASLARRPQHAHPGLALAALLPVGRRPMSTLGAFISATTADSGWPTRPALWLAATRYDTGRRVVFGHPGAPSAGVAEAVMASCAIPGWFTPVDIGGVRYIDGGVRSSTHADLLAGLGLDRLYVLAPMGALSEEQPASWAARLQHGWRRRIARQVQAEAEQLQRRGTPTTVLMPGLRDLAVMGHNLMDGQRRQMVVDCAVATTTVALQLLGSPPVTGSRTPVGAGAEGARK